MDKNRFTPEILANMKGAKSVENLKKFAQDAGVAITDEKARELFAKIHKPSELADSELAAVSGGSVYDRTSCEMCGDYTGTHGIVHWIDGRPYNLCEFCDFIFEGASFR